MFLQACVSHSVQGGVSVCHFLSGCLVQCSFWGVSVLVPCSFQGGLCPRGGPCPGEGGFCPGGSALPPPRIKKASGTHPTGMLSCCSMYPLASRPAQTKKRQLMHLPLLKNMYLIVATLLLILNGWPLRTIRFAMILSGLQLSTDPVAISSCSPTNTQWSNEAAKVMATGLSSQIMTSYYNAASGRVLCKERQANLSTFRLERNNQYSLWQFIVYSKT